MSSTAVTLSLTDFAVSAQPVAGLPSPLVTALPTLITASKEVSLSISDTPGGS